MVALLISLALIAPALFRSEPFSLLGERGRPSTAVTEEDGEYREDLAGQRLLELELIAYWDAVGNFDGMGVVELSSLIDSGGIVCIYAGRETCQYCRKSAPVVKRAGQRLGLDIRYLDTTNTDYDYGLRRFRELYGIETVPVFLVVRNGECVGFLNYELEDMDALDEIEKRIKALLSA